MNPEYAKIEGRECYITLEPRPYYCDRGNFIAKVFAHGALAMDLDQQDGWPRYYFNPDYAKEEIKAWLVKRGQYEGSDWERLKN
jgi:hypothetical protein